MTQITSIVILSSLIGLICAEPTITTIGRNFTVEAGQEVELPCQTQDNEDAGVIWKRNPDKILFIHGDPYDDFDGKMEVRQEGMNHILVIKNVAPFDGADYTCQLNQDVKIVHKLTVYVPPKVTLSLNNILTRQGENVTVRCFGQGHPIPKVSWRKSGQAIPNNSKFRVFPDGTLSLPEIDISSSGTYECEGSNGYGKNATAKVEVTVNARIENNANSKEQSKPTVETNRTYIPVSEGENVELVCRYEGNPSPDASWLFNHFSLDKNEHRATESAKFENGFSYTTLKINNITSKSFGDYICRVSNNMGSVQTEIYVSALPGPPALSVLDNNELQWTVESKQPITEYKVLYRRANEDKFTSFQLFRTSKEDQRGDYWQRSVVLDFLKPETEYELQVQAKNKHGWGSTARNYVKVKTAAQTVEKVEKTNAKANTAMTVMASLPMLIVSGYIFRGF